MRIKIPSEDEESIALMKWVNYVGIKKFPALELFHHIPNGGYRHVSVGARLKQMGVMAGVPDYFLPWGTVNFHGLYVELKGMKGKASASQNYFIERVRVNGYRAEVCYGWESAKRVLEDYLKWE
jgi:hypothetical protein